MLKKRIVKIILLLFVSTISAQDRAINLKTINLWGTGAVIASGAAAVFLFKKLNGAIKNHTAFLKKQDKPGSSTPLSITLPVYIYGELGLLAAVGVFGAGVVMISANLTAAYLAKHKCDKDSKNTSLKKIIKN